MPDPLKWDTRLTVTRDGKPITPVDSYNFTFGTPTTTLHSLEADNVAYVVAPAVANFTMAVKAIGPAVATLTAMALDHTPFAHSLEPEHGKDWTFANVLFNDCFITSVANTVVIEGVPTTTFTCICLKPKPTAAGGAG